MAHVWDDPSQRTGPNKANHLASTKGEHAFEREIHGCCRLPSSHWKQVHGSDVGIVFSDPTAIAHKRKTILTETGVRPVWKLPQTRGMKEMRDLQGRRRAARNDDGWDGWDLHVRARARAGPRAACGFRLMKCSADAPSAGLRTDSRCPAAQPPQAGPGEQRGARHAASLPERRNYCASTRTLQACANDGGVEAPVRAGWRGFRTCSALARPPSGTLAPCRWFAGFAGSLVRSSFLSLLGIARFLFSLRDTQDAAVTAPVARPPAGPEIPPPPVVDAPHASSIGSVGTRGPTAAC